MNKLLIVLLAICLVSVHAFVKRDAPQPENKNYLDDFQNKAKEFADNINEGIKKAFDPEEMKKGINEFADKVNSVFNPKTEAPK